MTPCSSSRPSGSAAGPTDRRPGSSSRELASPCKNAVAIIMAALYPLRVYLDTNVFLDVFEERDPNLFPELKAAVDAGQLDVVASDINLAELLAGSDKGKFEEGIQNLLSVRPKWLYLTGLTRREVV